jgi:hypothetical protein
MMKTIAVALAITVLGLVSAGRARADEYTKPAILTFNQPWEIPGTVFPAGTYMFTLADAFSDRHIVRVFNRAGTKLLATVMTISDYRLTANKQTVLVFNPGPKGAPQALRVWFYPGERFGREFVYPKKRARELAAASRVVVPALAADVVNIADLNTVPIVAVTPEAREVAVADAIQTTPEAVPSNSEVDLVLPIGPLPLADANGVTQTGQSARNGDQLPKTASPLPLIGLFGLASIAAAFGLTAFGKRATVSARSAR